MLGHMGGVPFFTCSLETSSPRVGTPEAHTHANATKHQRQRNAQTPRPNFCFALKQTGRRHGDVFRASFYAIARRSAILRVPSHAWLMARSEQLRQLAVQVASLESWSLTVCSPFWRRPLGSLRQSQPWSRLCLPRFCGLGPARVPLYPKPPLVALRAPSCSASVGPQVCPSRAAPRLFLTARSPPTAAPAPGPPLLAVSSLGARPVWPAPPPCPSFAPAADPSASVAQLARGGRPSGAAEGRRRKRDKHRRRDRRRSKRSTWRET